MAYVEKDLFGCRGGPDHWGRGQEGNLKTKQEAEAVSRGQVALCGVVAVDKERSQ